MTQHLSRTWKQMMSLIKIHREEEKENLHGFSQMTIVCTNKYVVVVTTTMRSLLRYLDYRTTCKVASKLGTDTWWHASIQPRDHTNWVITLGRCRTLFGLVWPLWPRDAWRERWIENWLIIKNILDGHSATVSIWSSARVWWDKLLMTETKYKCRQILFVLLLLSRMHQFRSNKATLWRFIF